jgi:hypothetical protein
MRVDAKNSKVDPVHLRKLLYRPAVLATRCNPHVKALYDRMLARGKSKMAGIGAALRKLAHLCFGVVKSGKPHDSDWLKTSVSTRLHSLGLFPVGEGAGHADGILSAAADGIKVAETTAWNLTGADAHGGPMAGQQTY